MLKAPHGVYSCLGNHDYGDYKQWESKDAKKENFEAILDVHEKSGWRLLMNEHVPIEKNGQKAPTGGSTIFSNTRVAGLHPYRGGNY